MLEKTCGLFGCGVEEFDVDVESAGTRKGGIESLGMIPADCQLMSGDPAFLSQLTSWQSIYNPPIDLSSFRQRQSACHY